MLTPKYTPIVKRPIRELSLFGAYQPVKEPNFANTLRFG